MDLLISLVKPVGFWHTLIYGLEAGVKDYALALILITIIIKLVMVPLDFINRYTSKKSSRKQQEMKPELDKANAQFGHDKALLNQKTMEIYKTHKFSIGGTCLGMLGYMAFTMVVFWTLFGALNQISAYKISDQFLQVRSEYFATYGINVDELGEETAMDKLTTITATMTEQEVSEIQVLANEKALEKYGQVKEGFLWIENIWLADTTINPIMKYSEFLKKSGIAETQVTEAEYNLIISPIKDNSKTVNGYYILAILAAGANFLSLSMNNWISSARAKKKGIDAKLTTNNSNKIMSIIMPIVMGVFTLFYNSAFGLYIVAGALITLITSPLVTLFVDMLEFEAIAKEKRKATAPYDRKRK